MGLKVITAATIEPITLAEAKLQVIATAAARLRDKYGV